MEKKSEFINDKDALICLDKRFSTTKFLTRKIPADLKKSGETSSLEGGLRSKGYFKERLSGKPLISIITVVFNGASSLENCILSVIKQSYENIEFIIIDGMSKDSTIDVIKNFDFAIDYWISAKDEGLYDAMNKGVKLALGDYVYFLGSDDILLPEVIQKVVAYISRNSFERSIYYGDVYMPGKHALYDGYFCKLKLAKRNICHQAIFYPREVFDFCCYNLKYRILADYDLNLRLYKLRNFVYLPVLIAYFNDSGISSKTKDHDFYKDYFNTIRSSFGFWFWFFFLMRSWCVRFVKTAFFRKA